MDELGNVPKEFNEKFVPEMNAFLKIKGTPAKIVLLLDNALSHPSKDKLISTVYLLS